MAATGGREVMALLVARLMGNTNAPNGSATSSAPPKTTPAPTQSTTSRYVTSQSNRDMVSASPTQPAAPAPVSEGPSLLGSADQLKAARDFMSGATPGNPKSRGGSRTRVLSQEPSKAIRSSTPSTSSRTSYTAPTASPRPAPASTTGPASSSRAPGSISGGLSQWQSLKCQPPADTPSAIKRQDSVLGATAAAPSKSLPGQEPLPKFDVPKQQPSSPAPKKEENDKPAVAALTGTSGSAASENPPSWQMKNITNTLTSRASDVPAHMRRTATVKPEALSAASPQLAKANTAAPDRSKTGTSQQTAEKTPTNGIPVASASCQPLKPDAASLDGLTNGNSHHTAEKMLTTADKDDLLQELKKEVTAVTKRVTVLENDNFLLQKQVENVVQTEERRKFLGTDSATAPFGVDVKDPNGKVVRVQATSGLKVGDLIRRIRIKANLLPADSKDPRVTFGDTQLGHGMTLGEAGVTHDSMVLFTYSGV